MPLPRKVLKVKQVEVYPVPGHEECWSKTYIEKGGVNKPGINVLQHCRAAGAVAHSLVDLLPLWLSELLAAKAGIILSALHDVGKVSPGFQRKCTDWLASHPIPKSLLMSAESDHSKVSQKAMQDIFGETSPLRFWAAIIGAHHGSLKGDRIGALGYKNDGGDAWASERRRLIEMLLKEFGPLPDEATEAMSPSNCGKLWFNAGLITVADWLASDEFGFPPDKKLSAEEIPQFAKSEVDRVGFARIEPKRGMQFKEIFEFAPNQLQSTVASAVSGPGVYVIEGQMGCGKTEAALAVTYQLISSGDAVGMYFALPTQTTSNRIHLRVANFLKAIGVNQKVRLAHGSSWLLDQQDATSLVGGAEHEYVEAADKTVKHVGRDWFASSKRALLVPFGVGTVDQALLGVVACKHFFVRQFALAGKVVVLDEVHSYDLYTGTLIDVFVARLRELGATVVILSATLTEARRRELMGVDASFPMPIDYPLVSALRQGEKTQFKPVEEGNEKCVTVKFLNADRIESRALEVAETGACVLLIRNTVDEAQETFQAAEW